MGCSHCKRRQALASAFCIWVLLSGLLSADTITLDLVDLYASPGSEWSGSIVFPVHNTGADGPSFVVSWSQAGPLSWNYFYDADMNYLGEFHTSTSLEDEFQGTFDFEKINNVTSGDVDGDGISEIAMIARQRDRGVYLMRWNSAMGGYDPIWRHEGPDTAFQRALAIGNFSPHEGNEVAFGNNEGNVYLLDRNGNLITSRNLNGKTIQNIRPADMDNDGFDEMYIASGRDPGQVWSVDYVNGFLSVQWQTDVTSLPGAGANVYEIWPHPSGNPDGGWGIGGATEQEEGTVMGSMFVLDQNGNIKWQEVHPPDAPRAGGADFRDITGDGQPELVTRGRDGALGHSVLIRDLNGELLAKQQVAGPVSTMGPYFVDYQNDGQWDIINGGSPVQVYQLGASADFWTGMTNTSWNTGNNWANGIAPGAGNTARVNIDGPHGGLLIDASQGVPNGVAQVLLGSGGQPANYGLDATITQVAGTVSLAEGLVVGDDVHHTGTYTWEISGGTLSTPALNIGGNTSGSGRMVQNGGTVTSRWLDVGGNRDDDTAEGTGVYEIQGGSLTTSDPNDSTGGIRVGQANGAGSLHVAGAATVYSGVGRITFGYDVGSTGSLTVSDFASVTSAWPDSAIVVGRQGAGSVQQSGGTVQATAGWIEVGEHAGSSGTFDISGGSLNSAEHIVIGRNGAGQLIASGSADVRSNGTLEVGAFGEALLSLTGPDVTVTADKLVIGSGGTLSFSASPSTSPVHVTSSLGTVLSGSLLLDLSAMDFAENVMLVDNEDPAADVTGIFAGLPEGSLVLSAGFAMDPRITYEGGDGNDIMLLWDVSLLLGDMDCDGDVDFDDVDDFVLGLEDPDAYEVLYGKPALTRGDIDSDGDQDFDDVDNFVDVLSSGEGTEPRRVPEPDTGALLATSVCLLVSCCRRLRVARHRR